MLSYRRVFCLVTLFAFLVFFQQLPAQTVRINEVAATNTLLTDEDEEAVDWFELHNAGDQPVELRGWTISDNREQPGKWTFPALQLAPGAYLHVWASGKDRARLGFPRTLVTRGDTFRYHLPVAPFPEDWRTLDFADGGWASGPSGFGHGDNDDATELPTSTLTVQLRKRIWLSDPTAITDMLLHMDFDDGFVAYLNDREIARDNVRGNSPNFNSRATRNREAIMYTGRRPQVYAVNDIQGILRSGENILSLQVHNVTPTSTDLTAIPYLTAYYHGEGQEGISPPPELAVEKRHPHTNFRLSGRGEALYLYEPGGRLVDSLAFPAMAGGVSYGRTTGGEVGFFVTPTPEAGNGATVATQVNTPHLRFSFPDGAIPATGIDVAITGAREAETIRYTLDATEPSPNSPVYRSPIRIDTPTVIRARVFRPGYLPSPVQSRTYLPGIQHDLPVVTLVTEPANFFDSTSGIYLVDENQFGEFPYFGSNIWRNWERPLQFTLHPKDAGPAFRFNGGVKIFGGWSRASPQRSLSLFARPAYGAESIEYPLFPDRPYANYQALILRNSGNDWLKSMLKDATIAGLLADADLETQAYLPTATYLNGRYWGLYNLREKVNEHFLAAKFGLDPDAINLLEFGGDVIHGNTAGYPELIDYLRRHEASVLSPEQYDSLRSVIDVDNFILYNLTQIYLDNTDWPGNNIKYWRPDGGKWRWIMFDTDFGFGLWNPAGVSFNSLDRVINATTNGWTHQYWASRILRDLLKVTEFRHQFVNDFADALNRRFLPERVATHIDTLAQRISSEIPAHFARWGQNPAIWRQSVNQMKRYATERPAFVKQHLLAEFQLPAFHSLTIRNEQPERGFVFVNQLDVRGTQWSGDYFETVPVPVRAVAKSGYRFSHWEIGSGSTDADLAVNLTGPLTLRPVFAESSTQEQRVVINEINYNSSDEFDPGDWIELHNPTDEAVDLTNWIVKDEDDSHAYTFPSGTLLDGGDFLIVAQKPADFRALFPEVAPVFGATGYGLAGGGDQVRLFDARGELRDSVAYLDDAPWPELADGGGATLELVSPELDNTLPESWGVRNPDGGSPGKPNWPVSTKTPRSRLLTMAAQPNPFTERVEIVFSLAQPTSVTGELVTAEGKLVRTFPLGRHPPGEQRVTVDAGALPVGVYLFRLVSPGGLMGSQRLVKHGQ